MLGCEVAEQELGALWFRAVGVLAMPSPEAGRTPATHSLALHQPLGLGLAVLPGLAFLLPAGLGLSELPPALPSEKACPAY